MPDSLARRLADNQVNSHAAMLAQDAERLAATTAQYAASLNAGPVIAGAAWRIAQDALALAQLAARLDGMRDIAGLVPDSEE